MSELTPAQRARDSASLRHASRDGYGDPAKEYAEAAFQRAEEVATELQTINETVQSMHTRLLKIESASGVAGSRADDPLCANPECGHPRSEHKHTYTVCFHRWPTENDCQCNKFVPAPPPAEPVDKVLFHIAEAYRAMSVVNREVSISGEALRRAYAFQSGKEALPPYLIDRYLLSYGLKP